MNIRWALQTSVALAIGASFTVAMAQTAAPAAKPAAKHAAKAPAKKAAPAKADPVPAAASPEQILSLIHISEPTRPY